MKLYYSSVLAASGVCCVSFCGVDVGGVILSSVKVWGFVARFDTRGEYFKCVHRLYHREVNKTRGRHQCFQVGENRVKKS